MDNHTNGAAETAAGLAAGWASYKYLPTIVKKQYGRWIFSEFKNVSQAENNNYWSAAQKAFQASGLKEKGVDVIDINTTNLEGVLKDTFEKSNKNIDKFFKIKNSKPLQMNKPRPRWKYILFGPGGEEKFKRAIKGMAEGENACFHLASKNVLVNKDKMGFSTFHEMGHALNANTTKGMKAFVYGSHVIGFAAPILLALALIKRRKPESENEPKGTQIKKNFLKDNIGLITFGCLTPTLIEEGLASINGTKMAKKVLNPQDLKKLNILQGKAWSTYLAGAVLASLTAKFAVNIKDKLVKPKDN